MRTLTLITISFLLSIGLFAQETFTGTGESSYTDIHSKDSARNQALISAQREALLKAGVWFNSEVQKDVEEIMKIEKNEGLSTSNFNDIYKSISFEQVSGIVKTLKVDYSEKYEDGIHTIKAEGVFSVSRQDQLNDDLKNIFFKNNVKIPIQVIFCLDKKIKLNDEILESMNRSTIDILNQSFKPYEIFVKQPIKRLNYSDRNTISSIMKDNSATFTVVITFENPFFKKLGKEEEKYTRITITTYKNNFKKPLLTVYYDHIYTIYDQLFYKNIYYRNFMNPYPVFEYSYMQQLKSILYSSIQSVSILRLFAQ